MPSPHFDCPPTPRHWLSNWGLVIASLAALAAWAAYHWRG